MCVHVCGVSVCDVCVCFCVYNVVLSVRTYGCVCTTPKWFKNKGAEYKVYSDCHFYGLPNHKTAATVQSKQACITK